MSKLAVALLFITIFVIGLSGGIFFATRQVNSEIPNRVELARQIQDIVIQEVQATQIDKFRAQEANVEVEEKISPYAKLIIEKYYKKCGHTTVDIIDIPKELVNYTENELKEKYDKWEIKDFSSKEISIYREIDANCSSHFVIKDDDGYLAVYNQITDDILELKEKTDIKLSNLRDEDRLAVSNGIRIYGKEELSSLLEDFNS